MGDEIDSVHVVVGGLFTPLSSEKCGLFDCLIILLLRNCLLMYNLIIMIITIITIVYSITLETIIIRDEKVSVC